MKSKLLVIHQGWELYGSDRSFLQSLKVIREEWPALHVCAVVPKYGLILEPLSALVDEIHVENIGSVASREIRQHPLWSVLKVLKGGFKAFRRIYAADVVYINTIVPFGYLLAALFTRKPVVIHVREIPSFTLAKIFSFWFRVLRAYLIFNSRATCLAYGLEDYSRGKVILNAVEQVIEKKRGAPHRPTLNLLLIGRINAWKGHQLLVEAVGLLNVDERAQLAVRIVGEAPEGQSEFKDQLIARINTLGLNNVFNLFSFDANPSEHYNWSDIVVVPSILPEPFGRVAPEAMSAGKAVIAARHGGLAEIVIDQNTGWLLPPGDVNALVGAIRDALLHPDRVMEFGFKGKQRYMNFFSPAIYKEEFLAHLKGIPAFKEVSQC